MLLLVLILVLVIFVLSNSLDKQERNECLIWQHQSEIYEGFFLAQWQKEQCDYHGIEVNAEIKL